MTIRVVLVDDHHMVRKGLAFIINGFDDLELVGEAASGIEAIRVCDEIRPDVVLMDLVMPEMSGIEAIRTIRISHPETQMIALTSFDNDDLVHGALQAGAIGYLMKNATVDDLVEAIRNAHRGRATLGWEATQSLVHSANQPVDSQQFRLTPREQEVLGLMVQGLTNREISEVLMVSYYTINAHVRNILSKMNVSGRTEAVALALKLKMF
jgi:two-component system, NarL family, response regulator LiaR